MAPSGTSALHRVIYMSTAVGVLTGAELDRIMLYAKAHNPSSDITGVLLFLEGSFLQAIEGPQAGVAALMQRIRRDRRHTGVITLESGPIPERGFPQHPMHYVAPRNLTPGEREAFSDLRAAVNARTSMLGPPAPGADNGLWSFLSSFAMPKAA
jgi:hypothetical protein